MTSDRDQIEQNQVAGSNPGATFEPSGRALCRIELFGRVRVVHQAGTFTQFRTQKSAHLLAYLALYRSRAHSREQLIALFWPNLEEAEARNNLSTVLSYLRPCLRIPGIQPEQIFLVNRLELQLNPHHVVTDIGSFYEHADALSGELPAEEGDRRIEQALLCATGDLLPGCYEEWALREQARYQERLGNMLGRWMERLCELGRWEEALQHADRAIRIDPYEETPYRIRMRALMALERHAAAQATYQDLSRRLKQELGMEPGVATRALAEQNRKQATADIQTVTPSGASATVPETSALPATGAVKGATQRREAIGGALPLSSSLYIERAGDPIFHEAIRHQHSIVLVKAVRQMGKTSLLARGLQQARQIGCKVAHTDLQKLNRAQLETPDALFLAMAGSLALQLGLQAPHRTDWNPDLGANMNMEMFLYERVLDALTEPLVWALDHVDRLFTCSFGSEVFALFRSWHNERSLDPSGPWARLTLIIAYATEAHLLISDVNRSPFNVGTRLELKDFNPEELAKLNQRYGMPLRTGTERQRFHELTSGQPYLVQCGLSELAAGTSLTALIEMADSDEGPFGDHLRRLFTTLSQDAEMIEVIRALLDGQPCPTSDSFYRLRSAGLLTGERRIIQFHSPMYAPYLKRHLS